MIDVDIGGISSNADFVRHRIVRWTEDLRPGMTYSDGAPKNQKI